MDIFNYTQIGTEERFMRPGSVFLKPFSFAKFPPSFHLKYYLTGMNLYELPGMKKKMPDLLKSQR